MRMTVFLTGGTGFLGQTLLHQIAEKGIQVYALVRDESHIADTGLEGFENIQWVVGDITDPEVLASIPLRKKLQNEVTHIVHLAALYDWEALPEELHRANVVGTQNLIHFANSLKHLEAFHYASTLEVAGNYGQQFTETMFDEGQKFPHSYASTKFAAEACVRDWATSVRKIVYRFGLLVGRSDDGATSKVDGPYYLMHVLHHEKGLRSLVNRMGILALPFSDRAHLCLVPVDAAAKAVTCVLESEARLEAKPLRVYHVMGEEGGLPVRRVLKEIMEAFEIRAHLIALPNSRFSRSASSFMGVPPNSLFSMYSPCRYSNSALQNDFPEIHFPKFEEYSGTLFEYAKNSLFAGEAHETCGA